MASAVADQILDLERRFWTALRDQDAGAAARLADATSLVAGPQGVMEIDRQKLSSMIDTAPYRLHDFSINNARVRMISDDVAVVAYDVHEELSVEGRRVSLDAADTSTWVRRDGEWLCALHTESLTGDPFGRDRTRGHDTD